MIALDLIITESSICLRDVSSIYEAKVTDAFQTLGNILQFEIVYKELSTLSCRVSYVPRLVKVVTVFAIRQVIQDFENTRFRIDFTLHFCSYY